MGALKILTGMILAIIFALAIINYGIGFANDNNAAINIANDAEISSLNINAKGNVTVVNSDINSTSTTLGKTRLATDQQELSNPSIFLNTYKGVKTIMFTFSDVIFIKIFGNSPAFTFIFTLFGGLLIAFVWAYGWKLLRGNPD